jgi:L-ascorbate metabolism protein UlaG (beta-lactamase superfamily)
VTSTLEWFGCATFRFVSGSTSILLDAYFDRADGAAGSTTGADDIDACDWIVIGHSHFDHLYGAERIMRNTAAVLIGSYETVRVMTEAGVPLERMICVAGGETIDLGEGIVVDVLPSQHSCVWSHGQMAQPDEVCLGDLGTTWQEQQTRMEGLTAYMMTSLPEPSIEHLLSTMGSHSHRGDGGALLFYFRTPDGTLLFQDTSGHWSGIVGTLKPDVAILAAAGRANIDGEPIQGTLIDFTRRQVEALTPATTVLCHHDDWLPGFSVATDMVPLRAMFDDSVTTLLELAYETPVVVLPPTRVSA